MKKTIDELLEAPYRVIDILPKQVKKDSPGQYFAVERYFLDAPQFDAIKQKHINLILKLNCYCSLSLDDEEQQNPAPERIADRMRRQHLCIRIDESLIVSEPDDTYLTVYGADRKLLDLIRPIAAAEGLFVFQP